MKGDSSGRRYSAVSAARLVVNPLDTVRTPLILHLFHNPKARAAASVFSALCAFITVDVRSAASPMLYPRLTIAPSCCGVVLTLHIADTALVYFSISSWKRVSACSFVHLVSAVTPSVSPHPQVSLPAWHRYACRKQFSDDAISSTASHAMGQ